MRKRTRGVGEELDRRSLYVTFTKEIVDTRTKEIRVERREKLGPMKEKVVTKDDTIRGIYPL